MSESRRGGYFGTRPFGVPGRRAFCSVGLAAVCAGGRRPAREPSAQRVVAWGAAGVLGAVGPGRPLDRHTRASLGVVDLEARPGPAAAHERRSHTPIAPQATRWSPIGRGLLSVCRPGLPPSTSTAAVPSGSSGALHTSGAGSLLSGSACRLEARPGPATAHGYRGQALRTSNVLWLVVLGFLGAPLCVVTNVVNRRCFSCGFLIRCYKRRQSDGFFAENSGFWAQIDDVCNRSSRKTLEIAPV